VTPHGTLQWIRHANALAELGCQISYIIHPNKERPLCMRIGKAKIGTVTD
jgi:hypothetical protein